MYRFLTSRFCGLASALALSLGLCGAAPANAAESTVNFIGSGMPYGEFDRLPATRLDDWIEEGLASYVEAIARAQTGDLGLDRTPTWGRTYWGGALYCLLADVEIRRRSANRFGLQHALRAISAEGNMESSSALEPLLETGDRAVGVPVLADLDAAMKDSPAPVDLDALWRRLGVLPDGTSVRFDETAPEAAIRRAITAPFRR